MFLFSIHINKLIFFYSFLITEEPNVVAGFSSCYKPIFATTQVGGILRTFYNLLIFFFTFFFHSFFRTVTPVSNLTRSFGLSFFLSFFLSSFFLSFLPSSPHFWVIHITYIYIYIYIYIYVTYNRSFIIIIISCVLSDFFPFLWLYHNRFKMVNVIVQELRPPAICSGCTWFG